MDNLTHSLAGALLGQMGLKKLTGRAMPTLIIAANIPDIDAYASFLGTYGLTVRRGITHGPLALLLLPVMLTGLVLLYNRWRPAAQPVHAGKLLLLAYIGTLSHPALDWLNSYGIRLLEPFSSTWYAGDTLFIIDVWIWAALIGCFVWSRWREKRGGNWQRPAWLGFAAISAYIVTNGLITAKAEALGTAAVAARVQEQPDRKLRRETWRPNLPSSPTPAGYGPTVTPELVVANPQPLTFWRRRVAWRGDGLFGSLDYDAVRDWNGIIFEDGARPINLDHPAFLRVKDRQDVRDYLFWSRMPIVVILPDGQAFLADQRFSGGVYRNQFVVALNPSPATAEGR
mgnify:CR=1 FL=1